MKRKTLLSIWTSAVGTAWLGLPSPAIASSGLWGLGDGIGLPEATSLSPMTCEVGFRLCTLLASSGGKPFGLGYGRLGTWPGVDIGVTYGWPGQTWPLPGFRWRLVEADPMQPWNLAVGGTWTAEAGLLQQTGFLVTSRDLGSLRLAGGCIFDAGYQSRILGGVTWQFGRGFEASLAAKGPGQGPGRVRSSRLVARGAGEKVAA